MFSERLDNDQVMVLREVFPKACIELGIGVEKADEERREQLASIILTIAQREFDRDLILARAVLQMRPPGSLHSGKNPPLPQKQARAETKARQPLLACALSQVCADRLSHA
jgi:hypothetical protein